MTETKLTRKGPKSARHLSDSANGQIATRLRQFYDSVRDEEIPDRFLDLLEKLDAAEQATKPATGAEALEHERE